MSSFGVYLFYLILLFRTFGPIGNLKQLYNNNKNKLFIFILTLFLFQQMIYFILSISFYLQLDKIDPFN